MLSRENGFLLWDALVAGTRRVEDMSTDQIADLCRWNDSNGEWSDITEADRADLLVIVGNWLADSRAEVQK
jgi:hypothetical protein